MSTMASVELITIRPGTYDALLSGDCRAVVVKRPFPILRRHDVARLVADDGREALVRVTWIEVVGDTHYVMTVVPSRSTRDLIEP